MKIQLKFLTLVLALAIAPALFADNGNGNGNGSMRFNAGLSSGGSPNGFGNVFMQIRNDNTATVSSSTLGLGTITGLQLLQNGQPVLTFTDNQNQFRFGQFVRTLALDPALRQAIIANPQNFQFVVTTADQPLGAIRGNLNGANTQTLTGNLAGTSGNSNGSFVMTLTPMPGGTTERLDVDMLAPGLGPAINSLTLGSSSGQPMVTFANGAALSNGRLTTSTMITTDQANQLLNSPSAFNLVANTPSSATGVIGSLSPANEEFIPIVGTTSGINGSNWKTDLNLYNTALPFTPSVSTPASVLMQFFPAGVPPGQVIAAAESGHTIPAQGSSTSHDMSQTVFPGQLGIGAMRIISAGNVFANARIFNDQSANGMGTFGESVPALTRSQALSQGVLVGVTNTTPTANSTTPTARTNVGLMNPNDTSTDVDLELRDQAGNLIASRMITLPPFAVQQTPLSSLFNTTSDLPAGSVDFLSGAPIFVFGSVVDNVSGDASFIEPEDLSSLNNTTGNATGGM